MAINTFFDNSDINVYFHMKNHYTKLRRARSTIDNSIPQCFLNKGATPPNTSRSRKSYLDEKQCNTRLNHNCLTSASGTSDTSINVTDAFPTSKTKRNLDFLTQKQYRERSQSTVRNCTSERCNKFKLKKRRIAGYRSTVKTSKFESNQISNGKEQSKTEVDTHTDNESIRPKYTENKNSGSRSSVEQHKYLQFLLRITEDIIINNLFTNDDIERVFQVHIDANKDHLELDKMESHVVRLCQELEIPYKNKKIVKNFESYENYLYKHKYFSESNKSLDDCECTTKRSLDIQKDDNITSSNESSDFQFKEVSCATVKFSLDRVTECSETMSSMDAFKDYIHLSPDTSVASFANAFHNAGKGDNEVNQVEQINYEQKHLSPLLTEKEKKCCIEEDIDYQKFGSKSQSNIEQENILHETEATNAIQMISLVGQKQEPMRDDLLSIMADLNEVEAQDGESTITTPKTVEFITYNSSKTKADLIDIDSSNFLTIHKNSIASDIKSESNDKTMKSTLQKLEPSDDTHEIESKKVFNANQEIIIEDTDSQKMYEIKDFLANLEILQSTSNSVFENDNKGNKTNSNERSVNSLDPILEPLKHSLKNIELIMDETKSDVYVNIDKDVNELAKRLSMTTLKRAENSVEKDFSCDVERGEASENIFSLTNCESVSNVNSTTNKKNVRTDEKSTQVKVERCNKECNTNCFSSDFNKRDYILVNGPLYVLKEFLYSDEKFVIFDKTNIEKNISPDQDNSADRTLRANKARTKSPSTCLSTCLSNDFSKLLNSDYDLMPQRDSNPSNKYDHRLMVTMQSFDTLLLSDKYETCTYTCTANGKNVSSESSYDSVPVVPNSHQNEWVNQFRLGKDFAVDAKLTDYSLTRQPGKLDLKQDSEFGTRHSSRSQMMDVDVYSVNVSESGEISRDSTCTEEFSLMSAFR